MSYEKRIYRNYTKTDDLISFSVAVGQTDLFISSSVYLKNEAIEAVFSARAVIEEFIKANPCFLSSLIPINFDRINNTIIEKMVHASAIVGVGPMACVAGAVAEYTGLRLLNYCNEVIVENGGDIFVKTNREISVGIFAGLSPLSEKVGIKIKPVREGFAICTSSGTVGHSFSFGKADAVVMKSRNSCIADAAATAVANIVMDEKDIDKAVEKAKQTPCVDATVIIKGNSIGVWGDIEIMAL